MKENTPLGVGLHYGVPASIYHADPCETPSLSSNVLRTLLAKSPAHAAMEHSRIGGQKREATEAMKTGTLVHAILAGSQEEIAISPYEDFRKADARAWRDEMTASGRVVVTAPAYEEAVVIAGHIRKRAADGIDNGPFSPHAKHEVTAIWMEGDAPCRARYDVWVEDEFTIDIYDWKSTKDISDRGIDKAIASYRYDIQEAFYRRGAESLRPKKRVSFIFVFFETCAPYTVRRVVISAEYLAQARKDVSEGIDKWKACTQSGEYPVTPPDTLTVEIPHYLSENDGEINIE